MCDNVSFGCTFVIKLERLEVHREQCEHNPKKPVPCEQGCGLVIPKDELRVCISFMFYLCSVLIFKLFCFMFIILILVSIKIE